jgi:hypothetical protein
LATQINTLHLLFLWGLLWGCLHYAYGQTTSCEQELPVQVYGMYVDGEITYEEYYEALTAWQSGNCELGNWLLSTQEVEYEPEVAKIINQQIVWYQKQKYDSTRTSVSKARIQAQAELWQMQYSGPSFVPNFKQDRQNRQDKQDRQDRQAMLLQRASGATTIAWGDYKDSFGWKSPYSYQQSGTHSLRGARMHQNILGGFSTGVAPDTSMVYWARWHGTRNALLPWIVGLWQANGRYAELILPNYNWAGVPNGILNGHINAHIIWQLNPLAEQGATKKTIGKAEYLIQHTQRGHKYSHSVFAYYKQANYQNQYRMHSQAKVQQKYAELRIRQRWSEPNHKKIKMTNALRVVHWGEISDSIQAINTIRHVWSLQWAFLPNMHGLLQTINANVWNFAGTALKVQLQFHSFRFTVLKKGEWLGQSFWEPEVQYFVKPSNAPQSWQWKAAARYRQDHSIRLQLEQKAFTTQSAKGSQLHRPQFWIQASQIALYTSKSAVTWQGKIEIGMHQ